MPVKLFLFDQNRLSLAERLAKLDDRNLYLERLIEDYAPDSFRRSDKGELWNNPWVPEGPDREPLLRSSDGWELGFGVPLVIPSRETARALLSAIEPAKSEGAPVAGAELTPMTADLAPEGQHWCAGRGAGYSFGTRSAARRLIGADSLVQNELRGEGVNVFIVDQGLDRRYVARLGGNFAGGFSWSADGELKLPGEEKGPYLPVQRRHGGMMLRSVIDLAPDCNIYDLPLIPRRITGSEFFGLNAVFAFWMLRLLTRVIGGRWVILNAWGLVDRFAETVRGEYSDNRDHRFNVLVASLGREQDVIFAAGNNGQFCGDARATGYDLGPGRSIFGANGLPEVTCAGGVRTDGMWVGAASQGPGPTGFAQMPGEPVLKPDLAVPAWFDEDHDAALRSGGTSTSAAMLAGAVAALRSDGEIASLTPDDLRARLRETARPTNGPGWSRRTGTGILDVRGVISGPSPAPTRITAARGFPWLDRLFRRWWRGRWPSAEGTPR